MTNADTMSGAARRDSEFLPVRLDGASNWQVDRVLDDAIASLPPAGSPEAAEAFRGACQGVDAASRLSDADMEALRIAPDGFTLWTSDKVQDALDGKFSRFLPKEIEAARSVPRTRLRELQILTLRRELRMAEAAKSSRIHELHALAYGDEPDPAGESEAPAADEPAITQAIEAHRAAQTALTAASWAHDVEHVRKTGGDTSDEAMAAAQAAWEAASDAETAAWGALLATRPASASGLLQMLRYIASATAALESVTSPRAFARSIAEAAETALARGADEGVNWHSPPAGFMAFPAIKPMSFLNIRYGIVAELERLRDIARAEYARREPLFQESFTQADLEARLSALRDELRLSALDAAIADPKTARAADADLIALAEPWDAARRLYDQRIEEQTEVERIAEAAAKYPGPAPEGSGADFKEWRNRVDEYRKQTGVDHAEAESNDALDDLAEIEDRVAAMQAHTLVGLRLKARIAERNSSIDVEWPQGLGEGMVRDILALAGVGGAPAETQDTVVDDFEPWDLHGDCPVPSNDEWIKQARLLLPWLRISFAFMCQDKATLAKALMDMEKEVFDETIQGISATRDYLGGLADLAEAVLGRVVIALETHPANPDSAEA